MQAFLLDTLETQSGGRYMVFAENWSVQRKILLVTLVLTMISAFIGLTGYLGISRVIVSMDTIYDTTLAQERFLGAMESQLYRLDRNLQAVTMAGSHAEMLDATDNFNGHLHDVRQTWLEYMQTAHDDTANGENLYARFIGLLDEYAEQSDDVINGSVVTAMETAKEASKTIDSAIGILQDIAGEFMDDALALQAHTQDVQYKAYRILVILVMAGVALGLLLSFWVAVSVCRPLEIVVQGLDQIASGNLNVDLPTTSRQDEMGHLLIQLRDMCGSLQQAVGGILAAAGNIETGTAEAAAGISEVGASIQEVASTANQFAHNVQQVSEHAKLMEEESRGVTDMADEGINRLVETADRMRAIDTQTQAVTKSIAELQTRSQEIEHIVTLILDIAAQTNLLALNAAIEAARAGEFGRGFAVVAEEVRSLANQTDSAAARISELVQQIQAETLETVDQNREMVREVQGGTRAMEATDQAFAGIKAAIENMGLRIGEVADAAAQIGTGSQQIAGATEEQSAFILNLAEVTETLTRSAEELKRAVETFEL